MDEERTGHGGVSGRKTHVDIHGASPRILDGSSGVLHRRQEIPLRAFQRSNQTESQWIDRVINADEMMICKCVFYPNFHPLRAPGFFRLDVPLDFILHHWFILLLLGGGLLFLIVCLLLGTLCCGRYNWYANILIFLVFVEGGRAGSGYILQDAAEWIWQSVSGGIF